MPVPYLSHKEKEWAYAMWCNGHTKKTNSRCPLCTRKDGCPSDWQPTKNKTYFKI